MDETKPGVEDSSPSDYDTAQRILFNMVEDLTIMMNESVPTMRAWDRDVLDAAIIMDEALLDLKDGKISLERSVLKINMWAGKVKREIKAHSREKIGFAAGGGNVVE